MIQNQDEVPTIGRFGPCLRGKTTISMSFHVQREMPNANKDSFDLPYVIEGEDGSVVEQGVFTGCYITHVSHGDIDPNVMTVEPVESLTDRICPFKVP